MGLEASVGGEGLVAITRLRLAQGCGKPVKGCEHHVTMLLQLQQARTVAQGVGEDLAAVPAVR